MSDDVHHTRLHASPSKQRSSAVWVHACRLVHVGRVQAECCRLLRSGLRAGVVLHTVDFERGDRQQMPKLGVPLQWYDRCSSAPPTETLTIINSHYLVNVTDTGDFRYRYASPQFWEGPFRPVSLSTYPRVPCLLLEATTPMTIWLRYKILRAHAHARQLLTSPAEQRTFAQRPNMCAQALCHLLSCQCAHTVHQNVIQMPVTRCVPGTCLASFANAGCTPCAVKGVRGPREDHGSAIGSAIGTT